MRQFSRGNQRQKLDMNKQQLQAVKRLRKALNDCHNAGLRGGVYEYRMRVWPVDADPDPNKVDSDKFFESVEAVGETIISPMILDGGSGF